MSVISFSELPDSARLWAFAAARPLADLEVVRLRDTVDRFLAGWQAHGHPVVGARELREGRFILVGADERATGVSGCSADALFRAFKELEREMGTTLTDRAPIWYRGAKRAIHCVTRGEFRRLAEQGEVGEETPVFDLTVATVGELRGGQWERPARESWHAALLRPAAQQA